MPYRASGEWVMVKRAGRWVRFRKAASEAAAKAQAAALNIHAHKK